MAEHYENYHKDDISLPFRFKNPDGSFVQAIDPRTGNTVDKVVRLTPDEVKNMKGLGYQPEQVEPKPDITRSNLSQTTHDKD
jgi:hypothetical protein